MRTLRHNYYEAIGTVSEDGDKFRLTTWRPDGPSGHVTLPAEQLEREIAREWTEDPNAGQLLDEWSRTDKWALGLKQVQFVAAWNTCSYHGRYDLARTLDHAPDIDAALALIPGILRELGERSLF